MVLKADVKTSWLDVVANGWPSSFVGAEVLVKHFSFLRFCHDRKNNASAQSDSTVWLFVERSRLKETNGDK